MAVSDRNPYVGPRPFERVDKDLFFGREDEARKLVSLIIANRAFLLYAQSGTGKTSLLNARIMPLLEEKYFEVLPLARVSGLMASESGDISNIYVHNALVGWEGSTAENTSLAGLTLAGWLQKRPHQSDEDNVVRPRVIIFDQFEELFTGYPQRWKERTGFFEQLSAALDADPLLRAVISMREDFIAQLDPYLHHMDERLRGRFRLERLRQDAALQAVSGPVQKVGRTFAPGLAEQLVTELLQIRIETPTGDVQMETGEFVEPVQLQVICQNLWNDLPPGVQVISQEYLKARGDVDEALKEFYERCLEQALQGFRFSEGKLRDWFEAELITPSGVRGIVYRGQGVTGGIPNRIVDVLENLHLIRAEVRAGARWYELTHDRLVEPIQNSNQARRARRQQNLRRMLAVGFLLPVLLIIALFFSSNYQTSVAQNEAATSAALAVEVQKTATVVATQLLEARSTATAQAGATATTEASVNTTGVRERIRPIFPGYSVGAENSTAGTIGAFVRDAAGTIYLLTGTDGVNDTDSEIAFLQPGPIDGGQKPADIVGHVSPRTIFPDSPIARLVGLVRLDKGVEFGTTIPQQGAIQGIRPATLGMTVNKLGRTTGYSESTVNLLNATVNVSLGSETVRLTGSVITGPMSQGGDGGALVLDEDHYAVGIIAAGSNLSSILIPIQDILDFYDVELCTKDVDCRPVLDG